MQGGPNHVIEQRVTASPVQHLGLVGLHPRAESGGENYDRHIRFHRDLFLRFVRSRLRWRRARLREARLTTTRAVA